MHIRRRRRSPWRLRRARSHDGASSRGRVLGLSRRPCSRRRRVSAAARALYWIKGNNEDFDFVAAQSAGSGTVPNLYYIPNGVSVQAHGLSLAGLGGTFAPTWYEKPVSEFRRLSPRDDRRRHFVHEEVDACKALQGVDIFISHEAARPFPLPRVKDAGKTPINEVLAGMQPRLHLFGHHHLYTVAERQHVPSIGLDKVSESYLLFDGKTLAHQRLTI